MTTNKLSIKDITDHPQHCYPAVATTIAVCNSAQWQVRDQSCLLGQLTLKRIKQIQGHTTTRRLYSLSPRSLCICAQFSGSMGQCIYALPVPAFATRHLTPCLFGSTPHLRPKRCSASKSWVECADSDHRSAKISTLNIRFA